jgi:hypothetical protein
MVFAVHIIEIKNFQGLQSSEMWCHVVSNRGTSVLEECAVSVSRYKMEAAGSSKHWYLPTKMHDMRPRK